MSFRIISRASFVVAASLLFPAMSSGQVNPTLLSQFNPSDMSGMVSAAYDPVADSVWLYGDFGATLRQYSPAGAFISSVDRPGEAADDADLDIASGPLTLNGTAVPAGSLLFFNGESGAADVYAVDKSSGAVLASLTTAFGVSHVVGGAYHPGRGSLFLVQDRVPAGTGADSVVAEVNPVTGAVLNSFKIDSILAGFTVNYGDIEVSTRTGNLFIVSSDETSIAEFTPTGTFVRTLALPTGVSSLSGIALDDARGRAWVSSSAGVAYQLGSINLIPGDADGDGDVDLDDQGIWASNFTGSLEPGSGSLTFAQGDFDGDKDVDLDDQGIWASNFTGSLAPGGLVSVPEPAGLTVCGLAISVLAARRRRS